VNSHGLLLPYYALLRITAHSNAKTQGNKALKSEYADWGFSPRKRDFVSCPDQIRRLSMLKRLKKMGGLKQL
jgi:hypothetical protein